MDNQTEKNIQPILTKGISYSHTVHHGPSLNTLYYSFLRT